MSIAIKNGSKSVGLAFAAGLMAIATVFAATSQGSLGKLHFDRSVSIQSVERVQTQRGYRVPTQYFVQAANGALKSASTVRTRPNTLAQLRAGQPSEIVRYAVRNRVMHIARPGRIN